MGEVGGGGSWGGSFLCAFDAGFLSRIFLSQYRGGTRLDSIEEESRPRLVVLRGLVSPKMNEQSVHFHKDSERARYRWQARGAVFLLHFPSALHFHFQRDPLLFFLTAVEMLSLSSFANLNCSWAPQLARILPVRQGGKRSPTCRRAHKFPLSPRFFFIFYPNQASCLASPTPRFCKP